MKPKLESLHGHHRLLICTTYSVMIECKLGLVGLKLAECLRRLLVSSLPRCPPQASGTLVSAIATVSTTISIPIPVTISISISIAVIVVIVTVTVVVLVAIAVAIVTVTVAVSSLVAALVVAVVTAISRISHVSGSRFRHRECGCQLREGRGCRVNVQQGVDGSEVLQRLVGPSVGISLDGLGQVLLVVGNLLQREVEVLCRGNGQRVVDSRLYVGLLDGKAAAKGAGEGIVAAAHGTDVACRG